MVVLKVDFASIHENNVGQLKALNASVFPIKYNEKFYRDIVDTPKEYTKFACIDGYAIGAICCRVESLTEVELEKRHKKGSTTKAYIMTLGVLAPYRKRHIAYLGTTLLESTLQRGQQDSSADYIYLHVQISNQKAIDFYKKFGFEITDTIENYYKDIDPPHCHILKKQL